MTCAQIAEESYFYSTLYKKPRCADNYKNGSVIRTKKHAIQYSHVQVNSKWVCDHIVIDIDYPIANKSTMEFIWEELALPAPTHAVMNPDSMTAHLIYTLDQTVFRDNRKQMDFFNDVQALLNREFKGDLAYNYVLTKNPYHTRWKTISTNKTFTLDELKSYIPVKKEQDKVINLKDYSRRKINEDYASLGKNPRLFEETRIKAYLMVNNYRSIDDFLAAVLATAIDLNHSGLSRNEVKDTARSIARWTWEHKNNLKPYIRAFRKAYTQEEIRTRQSVSAVKTNNIRNNKTVKAITEAIKKLCKANPNSTTFTQQEIAAAAGRSIRTVRTHSCVVDAAIRSFSQDKTPVLGVGLPVCEQVEDSGDGVDSKIEELAQENRLSGLSADLVCGRVAKRQPSINNSEAVRPLGTIAVELDSGQPDRQPETGSVRGKVHYLFKGHRSRDKL